MKNILRLLNERKETKSMKKGFKGMVAMTAMAVALLIGGNSVNAADKQIVGGSSMGTAKAIEHNNSYVAHFDGGFDEDWYKITPSKGNVFYELTVKNMNIETGGNGYLGFNINVVNASGDVYLALDAQKGMENTQKFKVKDVNETLYVQLVLGDGHKGEEKCKGNYRIALKTVADDTSDTMEGATAIKSRTTYTKKMEDWTTCSADVVDEDTGIWEDDQESSDVDYFKFTAPKAGKYTLTLKNCNMPSGGNDWHTMNAEILSVYEEQLAVVDAGKNETNSVVVKLGKNQTVYVKAYLGRCVPKNIGTYKINISDNDYLTAIAKPEKVKAKQAGKKINVTWKKEKAVASYTVYRSVNGGEFKKVATVKKGSYVDKKIAKGKKYQYKIVANKMTDKTDVSKKAKMAKTAKIKVK